METTLRQVVDAFGEPGEMRSIGGISRDTGLPEELVEQILRAHPELFRPSEFIRPEGQPVYTLEEHDIVGR